MRELGPEDGGLDLVQAAVDAGHLVLVGAALAAVQVRLSPIIAANKLNETLRQVPELVGLKAADLKPGAMIITPGTIGVNKNGNTAFYRR
jgi:SepF-like predicted cell division protein (DUF552 family)